MNRSGLIIIISALMTTLAWSAPAHADDPTDQLDDPTIRVLLKGHLGLKPTMSISGSVGGQSTGDSTPFAIDETGGFEIEFTGKLSRYFALGIASGMVIVGDSSLREPAVYLNGVVRGILPLVRLRDRHLLEFYAGLSGGLTLGLSDRLLNEGFNVGGQKLTFGVRPGGNVNLHGGVLFNVRRNVALFAEAGNTAHFTRYGTTYRGVEVEMKMSWREINLRAGVGFSF